jgi:hypothetical protein
VERGKTWILNCAVAMAAALIVTGCAFTKRVHYGHTEEEWVAMNEEQQAKAKEEFEQLTRSRQDDKRREQMDKDLQRIIDMGSRSRTR